MTGLAIIRSPWPALILRAKTTSDRHFFARFKPRFSQFKGPFRGFWTPLRPLSRWLPVATISPPPQSPPDHICTPRPLLGDRSRNAMSVGERTGASGFSEREAGLTHQVHKCFQSNELRTSEYMMIICKWLPGNGLQLRCVDPGKGGQDTSRGIPRPFPGCPLPRVAGYFPFTRLNRFHCRFVGDPAATFSSFSLIASIVTCRVSPGVSASGPSVNSMTRPLSR